MRLALEASAENLVRLIEEGRFRHAAAQVVDGRLNVVVFVLLIEGLGQKDPNAGRPLRRSRRRRRRSLVSARRASFVPPPDPSDPAARRPDSAARARTSALWGNWARNLSASSRTLFQSSLSAATATRRDRPSSRTFASALGSASTSRNVFSATAGFTVEEIEFRQEQPGVVLGGALRENLGRPAPKSRGRAAFAQGLSLRRTACLPSRTGPARSACPFGNRSTTSR